MTQDDNVIPIRPGKEISFKLSPKAFNDFESMRESLGGKGGDVIRMGLSLLKIHLKALKEKNEVVITSSNGVHLKQIVMSIPDEVSRSIQKK